MQKIYTIGHSTRSEKDFIELLTRHRIDLLADIRALPRSRWNPQFNKAALEKSIAKAGMEYRPIPELGGLREPSSNGINLALENAGLRGYADYMQTSPFENALLDVIKLAGSRNITLMCAEASYTKCHRQLTSDALIVRKVRVLHILDSVKVEPHVLTPFARVEGNQVTYPLNQSQLEF